MAIVPTSFSSLEKKKKKSWWWWLEGGGGGGGSRKRGGRALLKDSKTFNTAHRQGEQRIHRA